MHCPYDGNHLFPTYQRGYTVKLTFQELGLQFVDFSGLTYAQAHPIIVNHVCDFLMLYYFYGRVEEECIPDPCGAFVNFILQTVEIDTAIPSIPVTH